MKKLIALILSLTLVLAFLPSCGAINKNEVAVFKHGKKITTLQKEQYEAVNLLNTNSTKGLLTVEHVTMEPYLNDATVTLFVRNSQKRVKSKIVNDKFVMNFDISLFVCKSCCCKTIF